MHLPQHPELLDKLAASYALGTLRGGARRRFETLAREQAPVRAAALIWQARIGSVAELQTQILPEPVVWTRIDNLVRADIERQAMRDAQSISVPPSAVGWLRNLLVWRSAAGAGVLAAAIAMVFMVDQRAQFGGQIASLQTQLQATPQVTYVAVLADGKADPSMLVTFDARTNKLLLQRVGGYQEASDKSLQLWALPPSGGPRSLGVLGADPLVRLAAAEGDVQVPALAITLEPKGGVPMGSGPTGPVLFKGALIQRML